MQATTPRLLEDIRDACDAIPNRAASSTLADYECDLWFRLGVERLFGVIGEALLRIGRKDPDAAALIPGYRAAIDFRNLLAHRYESVSYARFWHSIQTDVSRLRERVDELLQTVEDQS